MSFENEPNARARDAFQKWHHIAFQVIHGEFDGADPALLRGIKVNCEIIPADAVAEQAVAYLEQLLSKMP